jgi:hypothetical protein
MNARKMLRGMLSLALVSGLATLVAERAHADFTDSCGFWVDYPNGAHCNHNGGDGYAGASTRDATAMAVCTYGTDTCEPGTKLGCWAWANTESNGIQLHFAYLGTCYDWGTTSPTTQVAVDCGCIVQ